MPAAWLRSAGWAAFTAVTRSTAVAVGRSWRIRSLGRGSAVMGSEVDQLWGGMEELDAVRTTHASMYEPEELYRWPLLRGWCWSCS